MSYRFAREFSQRRIIAVLALASLLLACAMKNAPYDPLLVNPRALPPYS
jgi:hypothetical protein